MSEFINDIFLVGPSYCGKTELTKILEAVTGFEAIHVGDCIRKLFKKWELEAPLEIENEMLCQVIHDNFHHFSSMNFIIDNAFKNPSQFTAITEMWKEMERRWSVIWIEDDRKFVDFRERKREDDDNILEKRKRWFETSNQLLEKLKTDYPENLIIVHNTDYGFTFERRL